METKRKRKKTYNFDSFAGLQFWYHYPKEFFNHLKTILLLLEKSRGQSAESRAPNENFSEAQSVLSEAPNPERQMFADDISSDIFQLSYCPGCDS